MRFSGDYNELAIYNAITFIAAKETIMAGVLQELLTKGKGI